MKKFLVSIAVIIAVLLGFGIFRQMTSVKNVVVVYTPHYFDYMKEINHLFEDANPGIKVQMVRGPTTQIEDRIRSEKAHPMGDVVYGGDSNTYMQLKKNNLIQPSSLSVANKIPESMKDPMGYWYAPHQYAGIIVYNSQLVTKDKAPKDWDDLLKPEWKDSVILMNPTLSGTMRTFYIALIKVWGEDKAFDYFTKLDKQLDGKYLIASDKLMESMARGEGKISLWNEADILKQKLKKNMPFDIVFPASGTYMSPEPMAIIAGAPHFEAAQKYMEFVFSLPVQELAANKFYKRPTRSDLPKAKLPEEFRSNTKTFPIDWGSIGDKGAAWLQKWSEEVWHKKAS